MSLDILKTVEEGPTLIAQILKTVKDVETLEDTPQAQVVKQDGITLKGMIQSLLCMLVLIGSLCMPAHAFNLITDLQQNLQWNLGSTASVGTTIVLTTGQLRYSELAGVNSYRFLSTWYGVTEQKDSNGNAFDIEDSFKIGVNVGYFFSGFTNKPPSIISNLIVGPNVSTPLFSNLGTRQPVLPGFDVNYQFGGK